jgi:oxygen-independent coproporphyrinogen-3 oxidase
MATRRSSCSVAPPLGLYVHVPFCEVKCSYCHFAIDPRRPGEERQERYLRALLAELAAAPAAAVDTLYLGGGTPSLLAPERLARIVAAARERFGLPNGAELTLEANPKDLDLEGYRALVDIGINRLSLGVQSLDDAVLREMGRQHTASDGIAAVGLARRAGVQSVSVDLILGWPEETGARWRASLEGVLAADPDHLSLYVLEVEEKTLLAHRARRGTLRLPDDDLVADLYSWATERLARAGLARYEISNFARPGFESRHNGKYWDDAPFLGVGMAAHSYREGRRSWNEPSFGAYCRAIEERATALAGERLLSARERAADALFTGLRRREGIDLAGFGARYGYDPLVEHAGALRGPREAGWVMTDGHRLWLTERGVLVSNEVFQALL